MTQVVVIEETKTSGSSSAKPMERNIWMKRLLDNEIQFLQKRTCGYLHYERFVTGSGAIQRIEGYGSLDRHKRLLASELLKWADWNWCDGPRDGKVFFYCMTTNPCPFYADMG